MMPTVCQYLPVAVIMLFAGKLGARFRTARGLRLWDAHGGRVNLALYLVGGTNVWMFLAVCLLSGVGNAFIFLLVWAIAADAIDYNEVSYGLHDEATSYAFFTFMRKLARPSRPYL